LTYAKVLRNLQILNKLNKEAMNKLLTLGIAVFLIFGTAVAQEDASALQNEMLTLKRQIENLKFKNQELQKKVTQSHQGLVQANDTISMQLQQQAELISSISSNNESIQESIAQLTEKNKQKFKKTKSALYTLGIIIIILLAGTIIYSVLDRKDFIKLKKLNDQKAESLSQKIKELEINLKNQISSQEKALNEKMEGIKQHIKELEGKLK